MAVVVVREYPSSTKQRITASTICWRVEALFCACQPIFSGLSGLRCGFDERLAGTGFPLLIQGCVGCRKKSKMIESGIRDC
jgi:hypothetical protein